jgi:hypothetical protein
MKMSKFCKYVGVCSVTTEGEGVSLVSELLECEAPSSEKPDAATAINFGGAGTVLECKLSEKGSCSGFKPGGRRPERFSGW